MKLVKKLFSLLLCFTMVISNAVTVRAATNLAFGKTAFASSTYDEAGNYTPEKVTDGDYNNIWSMGSITLLGPRGGVDQYIAVDLGEAYMLDSIVAASRRGLDDANARSGWYAQVANDEYFTDAVTIRAGYGTVEYEGNYTFFCDLDKPYRYVRICSPLYFTVAEIEVYGEKYDPTTMNRKVVFTDTKGEFYEPGAMLCSALNIMTGISKTEFAGEKILTRAQAARIITAFAQIEVEKSENQVFADVPPDHWAADYIYTATKANIISADENFRPEDYVTDREFLKLVLYAMGYGEYVELSGGWDKGIYHVSNALNLTKKAKVSTYGNLTRGSASMILFNALNSPLPKMLEFRDDGGYYMGESDETMLESEFGLTVITGLMTENSTTSLIEPKDNGAGFVKIGNKEYLESDQIMEFWIGQNVGVAVDVETKTEIKAAWLDANQNKIVKVNDFQRLYIDADRYEYEDEEGKKHKLKINDEMFLIKNNSAIVDWTEDDLICPDGYIEFINNDNDDEYDVAFCFEPQIMVVSYAANDSGKVSVVSFDGTMVSGDNLNYLSITKNGKNTTAGRIVEGDIVKAYQSECGKSLWIEASDISATAKIGSVYEDKAVLDGDEVEYTEFYRNNRENTVSLTPGSTMKILFDDTGRIVWVMKDSADSDEETIGYVIKVSNINDLSDTPIKIKFYTENGTFATHYAAEKIFVDGTRYKVEELCDMMQSGSIDLEGEFAMFKVDKDDRITYLDTESVGTESDSKVTPLTDSSGRKVSFEAFNGTFGNIHNYPAAEGIYENTYLQQPLKRDTLAFIIPIDESGAPVDSGYEGFYDISTAEHTWTTLEPISDRTEFYGLDENNYPAFGVKYRVYPAGSKDEMRAVNNNNANGMIVTKVKDTVDEDNEVVKEIHGYNMANGRETVIKTSGNLTKFIETGRIQQEKPEWINERTKYLSLPVPSSDQEEFEGYCKNISELKTGDIILYQISGNYISSLERVFAIEDVDISTYLSNKGSYYTSGSGSSYPETMGASFKLMYGKVKGLRDGVIKYQNVPDSDPDAKSPMHIQYAKMSALFIVEAGRITVEPAANLPTYISLTDETEMIVHSSTGNFRSAVIYK